MKSAIIEVDTLYFVYTSIKLKIVFISHANNLQQAYKKSVVGFNDGINNTDCVSVGYACIYKH